MPDRRRIVTFSTGGRPIVELDLEVTSTYEAIKDTFAYQPGAQNSLGSREPGRYGGQHAVGETNDNGTVSWQALVRGATPDIAAANIEALLAAANRATRGRRLEWRPDGSTYSSYFRIAGPGTWKPNISWAQWQGAGSMVVDVTFPVRPLVLWDPMNVGDLYDVDTRSDYTFDASTSADVIPSGTVFGLSPVVGAALTAERRARHTVRGYQLLDCQATIFAQPQTTITGWKAGVLLRASANTYVEVYVDDNGTNSRLRTDVVIAGVRTNRASVNLGSRVSTPINVRGRIENGVVFAEHFAGASPTPMGTPTTVAPAGGAGYTLVGGDAPLNTTAGFAGWSWVPQNIGSTLGNFQVEPFTYRNQTLPQRIDPADSIPGTAPALMNVYVTPSGGSNAPGWGMIAWAVRTDPTNTHPPFDVLEAELGNFTGGWASSSQAGARGGFDLRGNAATLAGVTQVVDFAVSPAVVESDDFADDDLDLEVWARVYLSAATVTAPTFTLSSGTFSTVLSPALSGERYSYEYGAAGKLLSPVWTTGGYRLVRLGVVPFDNTSGGSPRIRVRALVGGTGTFGLDYIIAVPARRRAANLSGVQTPGVSSGGMFAPSTAQWTRRIFSDLSSTVGEGGATPFQRVAGPGGALIQPNPGRNSVLVKLSSVTPDDPTDTTGLEQLAHAATVSLEVTPRSYMLRSS